VFKVTADPESRRRLRARATGRWSCAVAGSASRDWWWKNSF